MKTTITWTFGNFDITCSVEADVAGSAAEMLLSAAAINILQRGPAGKAEAALAKAAGLWHEKNKKGELVRHKAFERNSIPFSDERAAALTELFTGEFNLNPDGEPQVLLTYEATSVVEHEAGAKGEKKFADIRKKCLAWETAGKTMSGQAEKVGFTGETGSFKEPTTAFLQAVEAWLLAQL